MKDALVALITSSYILVALIGGPVASGFHLPNTAPIVLNGDDAGDM